jgi:RHS repeat-associated protein
MMMRKTFAAITFAIGSFSVSIPAFAQQVCAVFGVAEYKQPSGPTIFHYVPTLTEAGKVFLEVNNRNLAYNGVAHCMIDQGVRYADGGPPAYVGNHLIKHWGRVNQQCAFGNPNYGTDVPFENDVIIYAFNVGCPQYFVAADPEPQAEPGDSCKNPPQKVGDPINPVNGAVIKTEGDCGIDSGSKSIGLRRFYSSKNVTDGWMGKGWRHGFSRRVDQTTQHVVPDVHVAINTNNSSLYNSASDACTSGFPEIQSRIARYAGATVVYADNLCKVFKNGNLIGFLPVRTSNGWPMAVSAPVGYNVTRDDGQLIRFRKVGSAFIAPVGVTLTLTETPTGVTLVDGNYTTEVYDSEGKLTSVVTRTGLTQNFTYDGVDRLKQITNNFGHTLALHYSGTRVSAVIDTNSLVTRYGYDAQNRLSTVTQPDLTTKTYLYENSSFPIALTGVLDENNVRYSTWEYDAQGRAIRTYEAGNVGNHTLIYHADGSVQVTDALGAVRTFTFGRVGDRNLVTGISGSQCPTCSEGKATTYNDAGFVSSRTDYNDIVTTYLYDEARGLETSRTEALGTLRARTITTAWHPTYRLPTQIDEPGRRTSFTHDPNGNVLTNTVLDTATNESRAWTYTYNNFGQVLTANGPRTDINDTTTYTYYTCTTGYQCGQVQTITNALGHTTTFNTYNAHGQVLTMTDANNVVTTLTYDARQRLTSRTVETEVTTFDYYPTGLLERVTLADSSFIQYTYDAAHRLTQIEDSEGNRIVYTLDLAGNRTNESVYDPSNALTNTRTQVFNQLSQLYQTLGAAGTPAVTTTFGYDANGNATNVNAPLGRNSINAYDEFNRVTQVTDPANGITRYGYNALDQLISVTDPRTVATTYTYNALGDLTQQVSPDTGTTTHTYDSAGNLATKTDARNITATFSYDALNRPNQIVYPDQTHLFTYDTCSNGAGRLCRINDASGSTMWGYDAQGRILSRTQVMGPRTKSTTYQYNSVGQLEQHTLPSGARIGYQYSNGKVSGLTVNGNSLLNQLVYEPFGPIGGWTWGNGTLAVRTFDQDGRVAQVDSAGLKTYSYDNADRITSIVDNSNSTLNQSYGYDTLDRLTAVTKSGGNQSFTYDANGNRRTYRNSSQNSTYNYEANSNKLTTITGNQARTYSYDAVGNTTAFLTTTLTYDSVGRLRTAVKGTTSRTYDYNALGQRVRKRLSSTNNNYFVYDEAGHLIGEYNNSGALIQEIVWLGDIPVASLRLVSNVLTVYYIHTDHLNTPTLITQASDNQLRWRWDRHPFGTGTVNANPASLGSFTFNLRFPGQYFDTETGLYYNMHRYYDPQGGRYVTSDPIGLAGGLNTYAYAASSPTMFTDPSGLDVYRGPGNYYGDVPRGGACERAVFSGDYIVAWVTCNPELPPPPPGPPPSDYGPQACSTDNSADTDWMALGWEFFGPDPTWLFGPAGKGGKLFAMMMAAKKAKGTTTVIGRTSDLGNLAPGERSLLDRLTPNLGDPQANWARNSGVLRSEMNRGLPIRDASPGNNGGTFLNAERALLRDRGWTFNPGTNYWMPPRP